MEEAVITFEEIIKLNCHDWDRPYAVLNYHLDKGNFIKEVMGNRLVIYHNPTKMKSTNLIHDKTYLAISNT